MRRRMTLVLALATALSTMLAPAALAAPHEVRRTATYEITITNLTDGQWLTPPAAATHTRRFDAFQVGRAASEGIRQIAENGNLAPFTDALEASRAVYDWTVAVASEDLPPVAPGQSVTFELEAARSAKWFSSVSMLICTNDGFTGADTIRLPRRIGQTSTVYTHAYDAGTEVNTESWEDLVPPCAQLTGFGDQGGTGMSDPGLAEHGVVGPHAGILGIADLVPEIHGFSNPITRVEITRLG